jgi:predicted acylesterase/phospholipase RssA
VPSETPQTSAGVDVGIALSGGGHRATLFALGALLYLADAGLNAGVRTIASVSAGSIANAYLGLTKPGFRTQTSETFEEHVRSLAVRLAGNRSWWTATWAAVFMMVVWFFFVACFTALDEGWRWRVLFPMVLMLATAVLAGPQSGGSLWAWRGTWIWFVLLVVSFAPCIWLWRIVHRQEFRVALSRAFGIDSGSTWPSVVARAVVALASIVFVATVFRTRGYVLGESLKRIICSKQYGHGGPLLSEMTPDTDHVICATEMHAGNHAYFARDFVYSRAFGLGTHGGLRVHQALRASASFPLVFPFCVQDTKRFDFRFAEPQACPPQRVHGQRASTRMVLSDGGLFDNMGEGWQIESSERADRVQELSEPNADDEVSNWIEKLRALARCPLVVIDAEPLPFWDSMKGATRPVVGEYSAITKTFSILYKNATSVRARELRARFAASNPDGVVIALAETPDQAARFDGDRGPQHGSTERGARAKQAARYLAEHIDEDVTTFTEKSMKSGTYLTPLGGAHAAHLLYHGYLQAMITLHVAVGSELLDPAPKFDEFVRLSKGNTRR